MRIALIDLSSIHRAAWHAAENDEVSTALHKTIARVHEYAAGYDAVGVCIDRPPYKRSELLPTYKAQRGKTSAALHDQLRCVCEQLDADGLHILGADGYEADDIIATCADALAKDHAITVYSADKDLMQLVGANVQIISTATRESYDADAVFAKFGVPPQAIPDLLALWGDKSDNIQGVPGVGPKTAAKMLTDAGGLAQLLDMPQAIPDRFRAYIDEHSSTLMDNLRCVRLMRDAPIDPTSILTPKERQEMPQDETPDAIDEPEVVPVPQRVAPPVEYRPGAAETSMVAAAPADWNKALEPRDSTGAWKLAQLLYKSRMFGDFPNPEAILSVVLTGRSYGLDAVASLRGFHVIEGKVSPSAQLLIGLVKRHPVCTYFRLVESTDTSSTWETKRADEPEATSMTYTIDEARRAGLVREPRPGKKPSNWATRPKTMLRWRAAVELARAVYPDAVTGLYTPDEIEEMR